MHLIKLLLVVGFVAVSTPRLPDLTPMPTVVPTAVPTLIITPAPTPVVVERRVGRALYYGDGLMRRVGHRYCTEAQFSHFAGNIQCDSEGYPLGECMMASAWAPIGAWREVVNVSSGASAWCQVVDVCNPVDCARHRTPDENGHPLVAELDYRTSVWLLGDGTHPSNGIVEVRTWDWP